MPKRLRRGWFEVDKNGLSKLLEDRGKARAIYELIQNAWDQKVTRVDVEFLEIPNQPAATIVVADDDPDGFQDLRHAFTLFAESTKKSDPEKRGRFNIDEKMVLALCSHAQISTTTGSVEFRPDGTRRALRSARDIGSEFSGEIRITRDEFREALEGLRRLIPPEGVATYVNGALLDTRRPVKVFEAVLPTVTANGDGILRRTRRKTTIRIFEARLGESPSVYELGIPVVETGDRWHVDIGQKVPINMDRDNLPPSYLKELRALVLNEMHADLPKEDAACTWVQDALGNPDLTDEAITAIVEARFGEHRVGYDPSDLEANNRAVAEGFTLVHGRMLSGDQWRNVKRAGALLPAGQVFPTPKPYGDGPPEKVIDPAEWTASMHTTAKYASVLAENLLGLKIAIKICNEPKVFWSANYGCGILTLNVGKLGRKWFEAVASEKMNQILLHEFAHQYAGNHLSEEYHEALCRLGAQLASLALRTPEIFDAANYLDSVEMSAAGQLV